MARLRRDMTMEQQLAQGPMDLPFLMLVVLLTGIGVITVFSASYATAASQGRGATYFFLRQAVFAVLAAFACLLLVLTPLGYGWDTVGAQRWLRIPIAGSVQPSEVAKLGVILYFSARMSTRSSEKKRKYDTKTTLGAILQILDNWGLMELIPYGVIMLIILILKYFEPHM